MAPARAGAAPPAAAVGDDVGLAERALAKINLTLNVVGRRPDGYSELASIIAFADIGERLVLRPAPATSLALAGRRSAQIDRQDNSVLNADRAFRAAFPGAAPAIAYELFKEIPVAAGLGGGSADAAAALRGLARLGHIDPDDSRLSDIALDVGADVPVCLRSAVSFVTGIGEHVRPIEAVPPIPVLLVNPERQLATAAVFASYWSDGVAPQQTGEPAPPCDLAELNDAVMAGTNDLEPAARDCEPAIGKVLEAIAARRGCLVARMTGSGATCFGLFEDTGTAKAARAAIAHASPGWWVRLAELG